MAKPKPAKKAPKEPKEPKLSLAQQALLSERDRKFDASATAQDCISDLRNVQEEEPLKFISRNYYRVNGTYSDATWNQYFGTFLEFRRQAGLELSRGQHEIERKIAKHASRDIYRSFYSEEVLPYHDKYAFKDTDKKRFKTILIGSDFHDEEVDPFMLSVFIDTAKRMQPDVIGLNGDIFDLYEFSKYSVDIRKIRILERFNFVKKHIFGALRRACPNSQIDLIAGNHEWRLLNLMSEKTPAVKVILSDVMGLSMADMFGLDEFAINLICKVDLAAWSATDISGEIRENYKVYFNSFVLSHFKDLGFGLSGSSGHTHRPEMVTFTNIPMGKLSWNTTGCMADTGAEYISGRDKWTNSFMSADIDTKTKAVSTEHFIVPGDHVTVHGKRYVREKGLYLPKE